MKRSTIYSILRVDPSRIRWDKRRILRTSVAGGLVLAILVLLFYWDHAIRQWVLDSRTPELHRIMKWISAGGLGGYEAALALFLMGVGYLLKNDRHFRTGLYGIYAVLLGGILVQIIKHLVGRPRPRLAATGIEHFGPSLAGGLDSFPSGHAITAFALAVILSEAYPSRKVLFYLLAALIGVSRVYVDSHYASDVFAGAVLGVLVGTFLRLRLFPKPVHLV